MRAGSSVTTAPSDKLPKPAAVVPISRRAAPARRRLSNSPPWWFALPAMVLFAFVVLLPSARGVYYAFTDWDGLDPNYSFIGLDNFAAVFRDPDAVGHRIADQDV